MKGSDVEAYKQYIRQVVPYTPGEQPTRSGVIKLNTNENPYPPSPKVMEQLKNIDDLRKYPDPSASRLVQAIAAEKGLQEDQVFVGVGSDDVLAMCFLTFFNSDLPVLFPDITYSFYDVWADLFQVPYETKPVDEAFRIRPGDYAKPNGGILFPNPNAPTGLFLPLDQVEQILQTNADSLVIVDEAYIDFGGISAVSLLEQYQNLLVVQTFSKSRSMAGMRIGYAMGHPTLIRALQNVKYSFNSYTMNQPSIALGTASIEDDAYFKKTCAAIVETREWFKEEMRALEFEFPDSMANFLFVKHPAADAEEIFRAAKNAGIYVRYFKKPRIDQYLRITIGTREEMEALLCFLKEYLKSTGTKKQGVTVQPEQKSKANVLAQI